MSEGYFGERKLLYLDNLFWGLVTSSHILHKHGIFDAYGHVSVRNPDNPSTFFLPSNNPPALLSSADDIVEYRIEDANPADETTKQHFAERFIHSEIYKRFPGINAVIHSHCRDVLPFSITDVALKPAIHTAGFLGTSGAPVWDIQSAYVSDDKRRDLLVRNVDQGRSLSAAFRPETSTGFVYDKFRAALPSALTSSGVLPGKKTKEEGLPDNLVVLMRGHGFTTCAESLETAVFQAIYTKEAAAVQTLGQCLVAADAAGQKLEGTIEGNVNVQGNGQIQKGKVKLGKEQGIKFLSEKEASETFQFTRDTVMRPWTLWIREVEVDPLYQNNVKRENSKT